MVGIAYQVVLVLLLATIPAAWSADDVGALLAKPVSPGTLAVLIDHAADPRVPEHWRTALSHTDPRVRAVAARLLLVNDSITMAADLQRALATETDIEAAIEEAAALLALAGPEAAEVVRAATGRLGATLVPTGTGAAPTPPALSNLPSASAPTPAPEYRVIRTIGALPRGLVTDVLRLTGCKPGDGPYFGGAVVRYDERGGLQQVAWNGTRAPKECAAAARYLTAASLLPVPPGHRAGEPQLILLPLHDTFLTCIDRGREPAGPVPATVRVDVKAGILPPTKVTDVRPSYPMSALAGRTEGIVVLDSTVSSAGCISRVEVTRSTRSMELDVSAIRAVTGWVFKPTVANGVAVPVAMTMTVQFSAN